MAQLLKSFSSLALGGAPSESSLKRSAIAGEFVGADHGDFRVLRYLSSAGSVAARGISFNSAASSGVTTVHALLNDQVSSPFSSRVVVFAKDGPDEEYGALINWDESAGPSLAVYKRVAGSYGGLQEVSRLDVLQSGYYHLVLQVTPGAPNQIRAKYWAEGTPEPGAWDVDLTDASLTLSSGWTGIIGFDGDGPAANYKALSVGTNGDAAPSISEDSGIGPFKVIALMGQSNMVGWASLRAGTDDDYTAHQGKFYQYGFDSQAVSVAQNPLDHVNESAGTTGVWKSFSDEYASELLTDEKVLFVPVAEGGTGFANNEWNPGDLRYQAAVARVNAAMATNPENVLMGVLWLQGESDANAGNLSYQADLEAMYQGLIADIPAMTASTPFIAGSILGAEPIENVSIINDAIQAFTEAHASTHYVELTDLTLFDTYHYDAPSIDTAGRRFEAALVGQTSIVLDDTTPDAFSFTDLADQPLSTLVESTAITVAGVTDATDIPISVTGGEYAVSTDGAAWGGWTTASTTVQLGHQVKVRHTTSATNSATVDTALTIGGVSDTFSSTTEAVVLEPAVVVTIEPQSTTDNTPTIAGTVSREDVTLSLSINDQLYSPALSGLNWSQTTATLPIGTRTATITATDSDGNTDSATAEITIEPTMAFVPMYSTTLRMSIERLFVNTDVDIGFSVGKGFDLTDISDMTILLKKTDTSITKTLNNGVQVDNDQIVLSLTQAELPTPGTYEVHAALVDQQGKRRGITISPNKLKFETFPL